MKNLVFMVPGLLLLFGCWLIVNAYSQYPVIAAKMNSGEKKETGCSNYATVRAHYSFNDPSQLCGYILELQDGSFIVPMQMKKSFPFYDNQSVRVGYTEIEEVGFIGDCTPPYSGPYMGVKINCIQEVK